MKEAKAGRIDAKNFGQLCYSIDEESGWMPQFLTQMSEPVQHWVNDSQLNIEELPDVLRAYQLLNTDGQYNQLLDKIEMLAITNF